jgi:hypothetical protein
MGLLIIALKEVSRYGLLSPVRACTHTFLCLDTLSLASVFISLPKYVMEGNKTHI